MKPCPPSNVRWRFELDQSVVEVGLNLTSNSLHHVDRVKKNPSCTATNTKQHARRAPYAPCKQRHKQPVALRGGGEISPARRHDWNQSEEEGGQTVTKNRGADVDVFNEDPRKRRSCCSASACNTARLATSQHVLVAPSVQFVQYNSATSPLGLARQVAWRTRCPTAKWPIAIAFRTAASSDCRHQLLIIATSPSQHEVA